jgi:hypothetical protein
MATAPAARPVLPPTVARIAGLAGNRRVHPAHQAPVPVADRVAAGPVMPVPVSIRSRARRGRRMAAMAVVRATARPEAVSNRTETIATRVRSGHASTTRRGLRRTLQRALSGYTAITPLRRPWPIRRGACAA